MLTRHFARGFILLAMFFTLAFTARAAAVVANNDSYSTVQNQKLVVSAPGVLANDINPDGGSLFVNGYTNPASGQLFMEENGSFTYIPSASFWGTDSFTYTASDGTLVSAPATVTITVYSRPFAGSGGFEVTQAQTLDVDAADGVINNASIGTSNADGLPLTATLYTQAFDGTVQLNSDGSFIYTPKPGFWGPDAFSYTVSDDYATSAPDTIDIFVYPIPSTSGDQYYVVEDQTLSVLAPGVLANDSRPDGDGLGAILNSRPSRWYVVFPGRRLLSYTPNTGFWGTDSFTYVAADNKWKDGETKDGSDECRLCAGHGTIRYCPYRRPTTMPITPCRGNNCRLMPPMACWPMTPMPTGDESGARLLHNTSDGTLILLPDGSFSYTSQPSFYGVDSFTYAATSSPAVSVPATVYITVYSVPVAQNDSYATIAGQVLDVAAASGVLANDTNADGNTLTAVVQTGPTHGGLTLYIDGSFSYSPNAGFSGTDSFTYYDENGPAYSNVATVTITVYSTRRPMTTAIRRFPASN